MKRAALLLLVACGSSRSRPTDAVPDRADLDAPIDMPDDAPIILFDAAGSGSNGGFVPPSAPLAAWTGSTGSYTQATLDLDCLGVARTDQATTTAITLTVNLRDFQSGTAVASATVHAYTTLGAPFATAATDNTGTATLTIPTGKTRIGFDVTATDSHETLTVDQLLAPSTANQAITVRALSDSTVATLPALVGLSYQPGTGLVLGTIHDCAGANLQNAIATVSSTPTTATELSGADTYYFSDSVDLPVRHTQLTATSKDGLFMVIGLPATTTAYVQVWGFRTTAEQIAGTLTLIAELAVPLPNEGGIIAVQDPRATH